MLRKKRKWREERKEGSIEGNVEYCGKRGNIEERENSEKKGKLRKEEIVGEKRGISKTEMKLRKGGDIEDRGEVWRREN